MPWTTFYRRSAMLPFLVLATSTAIWGINRLIEGPGDPDSLLVRASLILAIVHAYAIIPYTLLLIVLSLRMQKLASARQLRVAMWSAPLALAVAVSMFILISDMFGSRGAISASRSVVWGFGAVFVGYTYVALIELAGLLARRLGFVTG